MPAALIGLLLSAGLAMGCSPEQTAHANAVEGRMLRPLGGDGLGGAHQGPKLQTVALDARHNELRLGLSWVFTPEALRVYRPTELRFSVESKPAGHSEATCEWNLGGIRKDGCSVVHTFEGGLADSVAKLKLVDGDWSMESTKIVPLERLEIAHGLGDEEIDPGEIPKAKTSENSFRFAVLSDSAAQGGVPVEVGAAVTALTDVLRPELVFHLGGIVASGDGDKGWDRAAKSIAGPLRRADIHSLWAMSPVDIQEGARVRRPDIELIDGKDYPLRYSFSHKGVFFLVFSTPTTQGVDEATLRWLKEALSQAKVYEARFVFSYLPLNKFTDQHIGSLKKKLRLYEIFMRARVTSFFTGAYRVYFKGRYGALPVVSTGSMTHPGGKLSGTSLAQASSLTVVDIEERSLKRLFAVEGPGFVKRFDDSQLPDSVEEVYSR